MKQHFLFLLLVCASAVSAQDSEELSEDGVEPKKGDTIWLEEKISPTTTWIESLVKPFTEWMEEAIQEPEPELDTSEVVSSSAENDTIEVYANDPAEAVKPKILISAEQAKELAKKLVNGDVLYIKLVSKTNQYRVKLISNLGEVRVIYIDATSGELVEKGLKIPLKTSDYNSSETEPTSSETS